jgi:transposase
MSGPEQPQYIRAGRAVAEPPSPVVPAVLDEYIGDDNPVRAINVFVEGLDLAKLGFDGVQPLATGRPAYHPATQLKIYIYGYLNRIQSSRRLERECQRNVERSHLCPDDAVPLDRRGAIRV